MDTNQIKVEKLNEEALEELGVATWPIWEKEISKFDWSYSSEEQCLFLEGEADIETSSGTMHIVAGDFVTFPKGLDCTWNILVPVKKHYNFS